MIFLPSSYRSRINLSPGKSVGLVALAALSRSLAYSGDSSTAGGLIFLSEATGVPLCGETELSAGSPKKRGSELRCVAFSRGPTT